MNEISLHPFLDDLEQKINAIQTRITGPELEKKLFLGLQSSRLEIETTIPWVEAERDTSNPDGTPASSPEASRAALMSTLRQAADVSLNELDQPFEVLLLAGHRGIGIVDRKETIKHYDTPPALFDPRIWFSKEQLAEHPEYEAYDPRYWDYDSTAKYDPREVEANITACFGEEALPLVRTVMFGLSQTDQAQEYLNRMEHKMRTGKVMMHIQVALMKSNNFREFITSLIDVMEDQYKDEAFLLGKQGSLKYQMRDSLQRLRFGTYRFGSEADGREGIMDDLDELLAEINRQLDEPIKE